MKRFHRWTLPLLAAAATPVFAQATDSAALVAAAPTASVSFRVFLPLRNEAGLDALLKAQQTAGSPSYHQWLTPAEFGQRFGPSKETMDAAKAAIQKAGLSITDVGTTSLKVSGNVGGANQLLGTSLGSKHDVDGKSRLVAMSSMRMAPDLASLGATVVAFSTVLPARPFHRRVDSKAAPLNRYSPYGTYWFTDLKQAYDYPAYSSGKKGTDGAGVSAAVLMADMVYPNDVAAFFNNEMFTQKGGKAIPTITTVSVDGGGTVGGPAAVEASLDVQQIAGGAPGSNVTLVSLPDLSNQSVIDGYQYIVDQNKYDIVNSSFGLCELYYTAAYNGGQDYTQILTQQDAIFKQGNAQGITFLASSGDSGGLQCLNLDYFNGKKKTAKYIAGVSSPASSAYVTAVGGGNLETKASKKTLDSSYVGENGFGDPLVPEDPYGVGVNVTNGYWGAGGGVSTLTKKPDYQKLVNSGSRMFRTLPDIGMQVGGCPGSAQDADNGCGNTRSAVVVAYNGQFYGVIGTSVSSPELVGAVALYIQSEGGGGARGKGRQGNLNTFLYTQGAAQTKAGGSKAPAASMFYHRDIPGFDGVYKDTDPSVNYNYIVGNGTPDVRVLFGLTSAAPAGIPQTATNP